MKNRDILTRSRTDGRHGRFREDGRHTVYGVERSGKGRWSVDHGGGVGLHGAGFTDRKPFTVGDTAVFPIRGMDGNYDGAPRESFFRTVTPTTGPRWGDGGVMATATASATASRQAVVDGRQFDRSDQGDLYGQDPDE